MGGTDLIEPLPDILFHLHVFEHRLYDEIHVSHILEGAGGGQAVADHTVEIRLGHFLFLDRVFKGFPNGCDSLFNGAFFDVPKDRVKAAPEE